ncbi:MAG: low molecular weight protein arginine phosphatase [Verrucomicrobia bacterium]|nr:low molecular weight protein arginine phosphatase [Verrucomicrobiota bacterium]
MAERLFAHEVSKTDLPKRIISYSAGLSAMDGDKASQNSIDACKELGLDISDHKSTGLTRTSLEEASVVFCMTESHRALINMYFDLPQGYPIFLMREFLEEGSKELPDPYGQDIEVYRECRDRMLEAIPSLMNWVEKNL